MLSEVLLAVDVQLVGLVGEPKELMVDMEEEVVVKEDETIRELEVEDAEISAEEEMDEGEEDINHSRARLLFPLKFKLNVFLVFYCYFFALANQLLFISLILQASISVAVEMYLKESRNRFEQLRGYLMGTYFSLPEFD